MYFSEYQNRHKSNGGWFDGPFLAFSPTLINCLFAHQSTFLSGFRLEDGRRASFFRISKSTPHSSCRFKKLQSTGQGAKRNIKYGITMKMADSEKKIIDTVNTSLCVSLKDLVPLLLAYDVITPGKALAEDVVPVVQSRTSDVGTSAPLRLLATVALAVGALVLVTGPLDYLLQGGDTRINKIANRTVVIPNSNETVKMYVSNAHRGNPSMVFVLFHQFFGMTSRETELCDMVAKRFNCLSIAVDCYRGNTTNSIPRAIGLSKKLHEEMEQNEGELLNRVDVALNVVLSEHNTHLPKAENGFPSLVVAGFCLGGEIALRYGRKYTTKVKTVGNFYGRPVNFVDPDSPPVYSVYGLEDKQFPPAVWEKLKRNLENLRIENEFRTYPGKAHAFIKDKADIEAGGDSADAWNGFWDFVEKKSRTCDKRAASEFADGVNDFLKQRLAEAKRNIDSSSMRLDVDRSFKPLEDMKRQIESEVESLKKRVETEKAINAQKQRSIITEKIESKAVQKDNSTTNEEEITKKDVRSTKSSTGTNISSTTKSALWSSLSSAGKQSIVIQTDNSSTNEKTTQKREGASRISTDTIHFTSKPTQDSLQSALNKKSSQLGTIKASASGAQAIGNLSCEEEESQDEINLETDYSSAGEVRQFESDFETDEDMRGMRKKKFTALMKPVAVTEPLSSILGITMTQRTKIMGLLLAYCKKNNMVDPNNKTKITFDKILRKAFSKKEATMFELSKLCSPYLLKAEECTGEMRKQLDEFEVKLREEHAAMPAVPVKTRRKRHSKSMRSLPSSDIETSGDEAPDAKASSLKRDRIEASTKATEKVSKTRSVKKSKDDSTTVSGKASGTAKSTIVKKPGTSKTKRTAAEKSKKGKDDAKNE